MSPGAPALSVTLLCPCPPPSQRVSRADATGPLGPSCWSLARQVAWGNLWPSWFAAKRRGREVGGLRGLRGCVVMRWVGCESRCGGGIPLWRMPGLSGGCACQGRAGSKEQAEPWTCVTGAAGCCPYGTCGGLSGGECGQGSMLECGESAPQPGSSPCVALPQPVPGRNPALCLVHCFLFSRWWRTRMPGSEGCSASSGRGSLGKARTGTHQPAKAWPGAWGTAMAVRESQWLQILT